MDINQLTSENLLKLVSKDWMLITAGNELKFNTMTASWGGFAFIWNRPVAIIFVRKERYTYEFIEKSDKLTLSFFTEDYRKALQICGSQSGRNTDKVKDAGLTPKILNSGTVSFEESRMILDCKKLFRTEMKEENYIDKEIFAKNYSDKPNGSNHVAYILEIEDIIKK